VELGLTLDAEAVVDLADGDAKHLTSGLYQFERPLKEPVKK
jgi:hypothetical protein